MSTHVVGSVGTPTPTGRVDYVLSDRVSFCMFGRKGGLMCITQKDMIKMSDVNTFTKIKAGLKTPHTIAFRAIKSAKDSVSKSYQDKLFDEEFNQSTKRGRKSATKRIHIPVKVVRVERTS